MGIPLIQANSFRAITDGFEVSIRHNWYRALPLSCVEKLSLILDGEEIGPEQIWFGINDHLYPLRALDELVSEYWFVQDEARLVVRNTRPIAAGETHTIAVELYLRAPYILVGPGKFMTIPHHETAVLVAG